MALAQPDPQLPFIVALTVAVLLIPAALGSSPTLFNDGDVSWHIATGQWILDHRAIPSSDPFSFTWAGRPWVPIEWLAEVLMGAAYRLDGHSGIAALGTLALMLLNGIVFFNATRSLRPMWAVLAVLAMDLVLLPMMLARPHLLAWPLIALWTGLMLRAREKDNAPPLGAALLMVVWANLHGSFVLGLVIAAVFALEAVVASKDRLQAFRQWSLFGAACVLAIFVNANGIAGVMHPFRIVSLQMLPLIDEWKPSSPGVTPFFFIVLPLVLLLVVRWRPRMDPVRALLLLALLALAFLQVRHQAVLAIVAAMVLPEAIARAHPVPHPDEHVRRIGVALAAFGIAAIVGLRAVLPATLPENDTNPWTLIAAVPSDLRSHPVLNGYSMGGPLILSGIRPYIDGRGDMYGDDLVLGYKRMLNGDPAELDRAVARWGIRWALLPNESKKLIALLDRSPGWRRIYRNDVGVIYVRAVET